MQMVLAQKTPKCNSTAICSLRRQILVAKESRPRCGGRDELGRGDHALGNMTAAIDRSCRKTNIKTTPKNRALPARRREGDRKSGRLLCRVESGRLLLVAEEKMFGRRHRSRQDQKLGLVCPRPLIEPQGTPELELLCQQRAKSSLQGPRAYSRRAVFPQFPLRHGPGPFPSHLSLQHF